MGSGSVQSRTSVSVQSGRSSCRLDGAPTVKHAESVRAGLRHPTHAGEGPFLKPPHHLLGGLGKHAPCSPFPSPNGLFVGHGPCPLVFGQLINSADEALGKHRDAACMTFPKTATYPPSEEATQFGLVAGYASIRSTHRCPCVHGSSFESVRRESGRRQLGVHGVLAAHEPVESDSEPLLSGVNREVETRGHPNHIGHDGIGLDDAVAFLSPLRSRVVSRLSTVGRPRWCRWRRAWASSHRNCSTPRWRRCLARHPTAGCLAPRFPKGRMHIVQMGPLPGARLVQGQAVQDSHPIHHLVGFWKRHIVGLDGRARAVTPRQTCHGQNPH